MCAVAAEQEDNELSGNPELAGQFKIEAQTMRKSLENRDVDDMIKEPDWCD